jgi:hypothetical protein
LLALFSLAAMLAFTLVGGVVGWRILRLARATSGAPERWIGCCLLGICAVGYPVAILSQLVPPGPLRVLLVVLGVGAIDFGLLSVYGFTRAVFRPDLGWLRAALAVPAVALGIHLLGLALALWGARRTPEAFAAAGAPWTVVSTVVSSAGFGWTAVEALRYFRLARRRVPLGLADPLVVNRVLLWGLVGVSSTAINLANAVAALRGVNVLADPVTMLATGSLGAWNAVALWLAFLPPASYARWVRARAGLPAA